MRNQLDRRVIHTVFVTAGCVVGITTVVLGFQLSQIAREPGTSVRFLPLREWFSAGLNSDGPTTVSVTKVYGPVAITRQYRR